MAIDETDLPGKLKAWIFQHGLLRRLLWPLQIYKVTLTRVEAIQRHVNKCLRKWLVVPANFTTVGLHSRSAKVQLPLPSVVDEFNAGKVRLRMMLRNSPDQVIHEVQPEVKSGRKWTAEQAMTEAEAGLQTKDIVGAVQGGTAALGNNVHRWFFATARWSSRKYERSTKNGDQLQLLGLLNSVLGRLGRGRTEKILLAHLCLDGAIEDQLPTEVQVHLQTSNNGALLTTTFTVLATKREHVLTACNKSLQKYTWRHNSVLRVTAEATQAQCASINKTPVKKVTNQVI